MTKNTLSSSGLVNTPGLIAWAINGYAFSKDRAAMVNVIAGTFPQLPKPVIKQLLSKAVPYTVDGDTVVFTLDHKQTGEPR
ncbi:hypothetical protein [uncultured Ruegeria sp.]|uniref:hypothetical protein n=1 Tax=uncultured Ruegeria sp. TaxID=259304 RepID=UPI002604CE62|nr:hypothetical protein [uncultured Ruegeria sp.]